MCLLFVSVIGPPLGPEFLPLRLDGFQDFHSPEWKCIPTTCGHHKDRDTFRERLSMTGSGSVRRPCIRSGYGHDSDPSSHQTPTPDKVDPVSSPSSVTGPYERLGTNFTVTPVRSLCLP